MPDSFVFPYGITLKENGVIDTVPVAEVGFKNKEGEWLSLFLVIDSGATISALPKSDALVFGIDADKGKRMTISGIGGKKLIGWQHQITVRMGKEILKLPLVFLEGDIVPRVLGRAGIFEKFLLVFEEKERRAAFIGAGQKEASIIHKILNKIKV
ncbi:MAG: hypothetical protein ABIG08_03025 [bacterium]